MSRIKKNILLINNIPDNIFAYADETSIRTIFRNLVSNALKFSFKGSSVIIDSLSSDDFITISVIDRSTGILQNIFKASGSTHTKGTDNEFGTGLGLSLCKEFVEKNGGEISIISEVYEGTIVTISIPCFIS